MVVEHRECGCAMRGVNGSLVTAPAAVDASSRTTILELDVLFQPEYTLIALYAPLIVLSLLSNVLLIVIAVKFHYTKTTTSMLVVNLSAADLVVAAVCMPVQLSKAVTLVWFYGDAACKLVNYVQGVAVAASVFTLTAMAVDRCRRVRSGRAGGAGGAAEVARGAWLQLALIWLAALLIFTPLVLVATVRKEGVPVITAHDFNVSVATRDVHFCTEEWPTPDSRLQFGALSFILVYAIPGSVTLAAYASTGRALCHPRARARPDLAAHQGGAGALARSRRRVAWVLAVLGALFALCWAPYHALQLLLDAELADPRRAGPLLPYALLLGHANSAINPLVYCLLTRQFQRAARKLLCARAPCHPNNFTWRCTQKPEGSSSDYELYHEPHKRCYLQMAHLRSPAAPGAAVSCVSAAAWPGAPHAPRAGLPLSAPTQLRPRGLRALR